MTTAFIFPGQGSQSVGMGKALADAYPAARAVFQEVDDALGEKLSAIAWEGPDDVLTRTRNAQPALMAVSAAALAALAAEGVGLDGVAYVAGHSLGEYSAIAAAGGLTIGDTARLLRIRGDAMQTAVPIGVGAMAALLGLDLEPVREIAAAAAAGADEVCDVANDNAPGQVVVSGHKAAVERAIEIARGRGARRAMLLPVSAPFHCALMQPAAEVMAEALARAELQTPSVPVVANVIARPLTDPTQIRQRLVEQVTGTVRWRESVAWLAGAGVTRLVEIGSGRVLTGLAKRIAPELTTMSVGTPDEVRTAAAALNS